MKIIEKLKSWFLPKFLMKFDHKLLLNSPVLWTSRAHLVSWLGLLAVGILSLIFLTIPNDPRHESTIYLPIFFILVASIVGVVIWLIYLLRFNVFKRFGTYTWQSMLGSFFLMFVSLGWFVLFPFLPSAIETYRADRAYNSEELVLETERMNFLISELMYDSLITEFSRDTLFVCDSFIQAENERNTYTVENYLEGSINICNREYLLRKMHDYDSIVSLGKGYYALLMAPNYTFLNVSNAQQYFPIKRLKNLQFYNLIHRKYDPDSLTQWRSEFGVLREKYASDEYYYSNSYSQYEVNNSLFFDTLGIRSIEAGLANISFRKYLWRGEAIEVFFRLWFYCTLALTLLVFIFRHTTTKIFFLTLLVFVLLMMVSGLLVAFLSLDEIGIFNLMLFYLIIFFMFLCLIFKSTRKNKIQGISLNIFTAVIGFLPLIIVSLYNAIIENRYAETPLYENYYEMFAIRIKIAELSGILLLLIAIPAIIYKAYRKWYSLPVE